MMIRFEQFLHLAAAAVALAAAIGLDPSIAMPVAGGNQRRLSSDQ